MPFEWREPTRHKFLKLREAPTLNITVECGGCLVSLESEDGYWRCPSFATSWDTQAWDCDQGELGTEDYDEEEFEDEYTENDEASSRGSEAVREFIYVSNLKGRWSSASC